MAYVTTREKAGCRVATLPTQAATGLGVDFVAQLLTAFSGLSLAKRCHRSPRKKSSPGRTHFPFRSSYLRGVARTSASRRRFNTTGTQCGLRNPPFGIRVAIGSVRLCPSAK